LGVFEDKDVRINMARINYSSFWKMNNLAFISYYFVFVFAYIPGHHAITHSLGL